MKTQNSIVFQVFTTHRISTTILVQKHLEKKRVLNTYLYHKLIKPGAVPSLVVGSPAGGTDEFPRAVQHRRHLGEERGSDA